ncbi:DNA-directed RNA polymerase subunit alpha [Patescibacteria group bacterium]|nr:DNA-directed RNA polymerase subunit alpha [Patescibacteria group bacterium]
MLEKITLPTIKCTEDEDNRAVYVIEPLHPGYGATIGNALRRTLLSSLEGGAITSVKIEGVTHEYSTIANIKEDVIKILLNIKKICFKMHSDEPVTLKLSAKKEGIVTAADFAKNPEVEIINPDQIIATIDSKKGKLELEAVVAKGRGYWPVEKRENEKQPIGTIAVDALFNPVIKVNFEVENTRVGGQTNLDKLTIEIVTDGSIKPKETLDYAASILVDHFNLFATEGSKKPITKQIATAEEDSGEDIGKIKVEEINLSTRTLNALLKNDIKTINDVLKHYDDLPSLPGLGARAVTEIKEAISKLESES